MDEINTITREVIGCAFEVGTELGIGYAEKVYENALVFEMRSRGLNLEQQVPLKVRYKEVVVGEFIADIVVEGCVLIELKAQNAILDAHVAQCVNYLKTTGFPIALILNFGTPRVQTKRVVGNS
ncbi:hypothetical protein IAD21_01835 [Abditibacteriota bacterium]|nr:hypothetical protein IAD21_01835 [Abditibacteriota bacterium]